MLGIMGFNTMLRPITMLFAGTLLAQDGSMEWMTPETRTQYLWVGGVLVSYGFIAIGTLFIAVIRRRWLMYGPRSYATRTSLILLVTLISCAFVAQFSLSAFLARLDADAEALSP